MAAVEAGLLGTKEGLHRLEVAMARIEASLATKADVAANTGAINRIDASIANLATKADVAANTGAINAQTERITALTDKITAQGDRLTRVETAVADTMKAALAKTIGPWQLPAVMVACVVLFQALNVAFAWAGHQPWFPH